MRISPRAYHNQLCRSVDWKIALLHYLDVICGGHFANKPELGEGLVKDALIILEWHEELGVQYDKDVGDIVNYLPSLSIIHGLTKESTNTSPKLFL